MSHSFRRVFILLFWDLVNQQTEQKTDDNIVDM